VAFFFLKALALFVAWKVLYLSVLLPQKVPDGFLTRMIGKSAAATLNVLPGASDNYVTRQAMDTLILDNKIVASPATDIYRNEERTLRVADACNGLELMALYTGFILCFPAPAGRKWKFALGGIVLICLLNVLRCAGLVLIFVHYHKYLDFSHHFLFTFVVYALIFLLWFVFTSKPRTHGSMA
jgi:exosortase/archaeosortase family protein